MECSELVSMTRKPQVPSTETNKERSDMEQQQQGSARRTLYSPSARAYRAAAAMGHEDYITSIPVAGDFNRDPLAYFLSPLSFIHYSPPETRRHRRLPLTSTTLNII